MASRRATPSEEYATDAEVEAAVRALAPADGVRLAKIARFRALALAGLGIGMSGEDLLQDTILCTLDGRKRWRKSVKFVTHLIRAIQNIASHAREAQAGRTMVMVAVAEPDGPSDGVVVASHASDAERLAAVGEQFALIEKTFEGDDEVGLVVECMARGMNGPEVQRDLNITQTEYETIMKRLRRGVDRKNGGLP
jgi:DNA-directed RNA polymerase specialized sigma24 family protein